MLDFIIKPLDKTIAKQLIIANHYSKKWSSCRYALGLYLNDTIAGIAIYGYPVGRQVVGSIAAGITKDEVLELTRLWVDDAFGKNTESYFIGRTFDWLRKNDPKIKILISYSDPLANHVGYIYQATNWLYQGNNMMLIKGYLHQINGELLHPRTCVAKYGTIDKKYLTEIDPAYKRLPLKKKHRYLYILDKKLRKIVKLKHPVLAYPKNNENSDW